MQKMDTDKSETELRRLKTSYRNELQDYPFIQIVSLHPCKSSSSVVNPSEFPFL